MSTLVQLEARVSARLVDAANSVFAVATIDEALRTALAEYSAVFPLTLDSSITLGAAGREISLTSLTGLINVLDVWWPYNSAVEAWPPNQVPGFHVWWNNAVPFLLISSQSGAQPASGDKVRVWYTKQHTIQSLDGAGATSVMSLHETGLVTGAAGYAAASGMIDQIGTVRVDPSEVPGLREWSQDRLLEFRAWLAALAPTAPTTGALKPTMAARNP
jgi:hypothetical protein